MRAKAVARLYDILGFGNDINDINSGIQQGTMSKQASAASVTAALNLMRNGRTGRFTSALRIAEMTAARKIQEPQLRVLQHLPAETAKLTRVPR